MNPSVLQHLRKTNLNRFIANCLNKNQMLGFVDARSEGTQLRELFDVFYQQGHDITDDDARKIETILNCPECFLTQRTKPFTAFSTRSTWGSLAPTTASNTESCLAGNTSMKRLFL